MRKSLSHLDRYRIDASFDGARFRITHFGPPLFVVASWGGGWDHVSASMLRRVPSYAEMCWVKEQFFEPDETAMQLHVPAADHINNHPFVLHLWRPQLVEIPRPPAIFV